MKIGVTQIVLGDHDSEQMLNLSVEAGFNIVELVFRHDGDPGLDMTEQQLVQLSRRFSDAGVTITSVMGRPEGNPTTLSPDENVRKQAVDGIKRTIEIAAITGAGAMLLHPGQNSVDVTYDDSWRFLTECMQEVAPFAKTHQVYVGIENVWNRFLLSPREMREFIDGIDCPWIGCYLDTANMMAYGYPEQWIAELGSRITRVHFKDFSRGRHSFVPLMDGDTDWPRLMAMFNDIGYDAGFIHEVSGDKATQLEMADRMRRICGTTR